MIAIDFQSRREEAVVTGWWVKSCTSLHRKLCKSRVVEFQMK